MRLGEVQAGAYPAPVQVHMGEGWVPGTAHADRIGRSGHQILVTHHGHMMWVAAYLVQGTETSTETTSTETSTETSTHASHRHRRRLPT